MSKLTQGRIPSFTECPFKDRCRETDFFEHCTHEGDQHQLPFSCAVARLFDIMKKNEEKNEEKSERIKAKIFSD